MSGNPDDAIDAPPPLAGHGRSAAGPGRRAVLDAIVGAGDKGEAIRLLEQLTALAPEWVAAAATFRKLSNAWHFPMMRDAARNQAYAAALGKAIAPGAHVLEIGAGSGLLAMMAARAGAARVTTCEKVVAMAEAAAEIVRRNGLDGVVRVVPKASHELRVGADLPEPADVLLAEIIGDELLDEQILQATLDARRRLLKPNARLIPARIASMAALAGGEALEQLTSVGDVSGFDLSPFNRFGGGKLNLFPAVPAFVLLSAKRVAFRFTLSDDQFRPAEKTLEFPAIADGRCVGVLQWVRVELDDDFAVENVPAAGFVASGWWPILHPFAAPTTVAAGQAVRVRAAHDLTSQAFRLLD